MAALQCAAMLKSNFSRGQICTYAGVGKQVQTLKCSVRSTMLALTFPTCVHGLSTRDHHGVVMLVGLAAAL